MAAELDIVIDQGSKYQLVIDVTGIDITGYLARGMVRPDRVSTTVLADFSSYLTVNAAGHQVVLLVTGDVTAAYSWDRARYDIEIYKAADPTTPVRILQGKVRLDKEVTH